MRVGVVTTSYPRFPGDPAGAFVAEHVRWLREAGCDVEVLAAAHPRAVPRAGVLRIEAGAGLFYDEGAPDRLARQPLRAVDAARFSIAMAAAVRRASAHWDAVVAHWLVPCGVIAARAARRIPVLAIAHSGDVHLLSRLRLTSVVARALASHPRARIVFVTEELRAMVAAVAPPELMGRTSVIPMGTRARELAGLRRARGRAGRVLFLGRLVPVKGVDVLIDAVARVPGATLRIAGDGPERRALRQRAVAAGVPTVFLGELLGADRDRELAEADVVAIPSVRVEGGRTEGLPQVALEAAAAGVPVVASRVGGLATAPVSLVEPGDPEALAAALARVLAAGADDQVAAAREWSFEHDWSIVGERLFHELRAAEVASI